MPMAILALLAASTLGDAARSPRPEVAVIVHRDNPTDELSDGELRDVLLGVTSRWPTGEM